MTMTNKELQRDQKYRRKVVERVTRQVIDCLNSNRAVIGLIAIDDEDKVEVMMNTEDDPDLMLAAADQMYAAAKGKVRKGMGL